MNKPASAEKGETENRKGEKKLRKSTARNHTLVASGVEGRVKGAATLSRQSTAYDDELPLADPLEDDEAYDDEA